MSLAVAVRDYMAHYRVQSIGTEVFRVIDGVQRIEDPRLVLPAMLGVAFLLMDELNLDASEIIGKAQRAHNHLKAVDIETVRAAREYIRQELVNGRFNT